MYKLYSIGARTEPCGTPAATFLVEESSPSTKTLNFLLFKKEAISLTRLVESKEEQRKKKKKTKVLTLNKYMAMGSSGARCQE
jgi:hypothetical protein